MREAGTGCTCCRAAGGPRAAAALSRGGRHLSPRAADRPPPAARPLAGTPLCGAGRAARGHRAGRRDRADQGDRPLRPRARGVACDLRDAERRRRDQAPLPRQGLGDPRPALAAGAQREDVRCDRRPDRPPGPFAERREIAESLGTSTEEVLEALEVGSAYSTEAAAPRQRRAATTGAPAHDRPSAPRSGARPRP